MKQIIKLLLLAALSCLLLACVKAPPDDVNHICRIFRQYPEWYWDAKDVERRWKVPVAVQMAIIHQESKFDANARPPRSKLLWLIPWTRPSTAYGYCQALNTTWRIYKRDANGGRIMASRDVFADGVDFIGWYANQANRRAGIPRNDAYRLYLAYHEGVGGYEHKTYLRKPWLILVARKVKARAQLYQAELNRCQQQLAAKPWYKW